MKAIAFLLALSATLVSLAGCDHKGKEQAATDHFFNATPVDGTGKGMSIMDNTPASGVKK